ncbi:MAG: hypothetical protein ACE5E1_09365 [Phycisphaerae bacterium]
MPTRKKKPRNATSDRKRRSDARDRDRPAAGAVALSGWIKTVSAVALASLLSAILYHQLSDPAGMLGAMLATETSKLDWDAPERDLAAALRQDETTPKRIAVDHLLRWLNAVQRGSASVDRALSNGQTYVAADTENLIARLAFATLVDIQSAAEPGAAPSPRERFDSYRRILETPAAPATATLYNDSVIRRWHEILGYYVDRPDVAAAVARTGRYVSIEGYWVGPVKSHFEALPRIQHRLKALAEDLRAAGLPKEAATCLEWINRGLAGLIRSERDAGTRLLCAELMARGMDPKSETARRLDAFRRAFHRAAAAAPIDLADRVLTGRPSVAPAEYRRASTLLAAVLVLVFVALGGALVLLIAALLAPWMRLIRTPVTPAPDGDKPGRGSGTRPTKESDSDLPRGKRPARRLRDRQWAAVCLFGLVPMLLVEASVLVQFSRHGLYAESWGVAVALLTVVVGALSAIALAAVTAPRDSNRGRGGMIPLVLLLLVVAVVPVLPVSLVTRTYRSLDLSVGALTVLVPLAIGLILTAALLSRARLRRIAAAAALVWCLHVAIAVALYQVHRAADRRYQAAAARNHLDVVAARLGPDGLDQYLGPILSIADPARP